MIYGRAQRKGKRRLERGLRKCDNSSAPKGQAGVGRLAQGVTVMVIKVLLASLSTASNLLEELAKTFSPQLYQGNKGSRPFFWWKPCSSLTLPLSIYFS